MALWVGIDVGSSTTKGVALKDRAVAGRALRTSGASFTDAAADVFRRLLESAGADAAAVSGCVATGYGRSNADFADFHKTEISCHARGVHHHLPGPHTIVDIGGQDNKVIRTGPFGEVIDFSMNRKCAAGTGAFLEEVARKLEIGIGDLDRLARRADEETVVGSFCTVFASTEMLKLIREGKSVASIVRGALRSVARRVVEMGAFEDSVVLSGGVAAYHPLLGELLAQETGARVRICPDAQYAGALGAALLAADA
jgi:predicted CoA-substrate-specific enzyme activase